MALLKAAAGYPQTAGVLTSPVFAKEMLAHFYATSIFSEITNTNHLTPISKKGDTIIFFRPPRVNIRPLIKNAPIVTDVIEVDSCALTIDQGSYFSIKIDDIDIYQANNPDAATYIEAFMEEVARAMRTQIDTQILCSLYSEAHCSNRGTTAGRITGAYNLGAPGAPFALTGANLSVFMHQLATVLREQNIPETDWFIVLPPAFYPVLAQSAWANCCYQDNAQDLFLKGKLPAKIAGFDVYISNNLTPQVDPLSGLPVYNVLAGWKDATAFAVQLEKTRVMPMQNTFGTKYEGYIIWGVRALYPEALAHAVLTM